MSKIVKDKNYILFYATDNDTTPYVLDINVGVLYGKQGKPLKNVPSALYSDFETSRQHTFNVLRLVYYIKNCGNYRWWDNGLRRTYGNAIAVCTPYFQLVDRLQSVEYVIQYEDIGNKKYLEFVNEHFKEFVKWFKEQVENHPYDCSLATFYCYYQKQLWIKKNKNNVSERFIDFLYRINSEVIQNNLSLVNWYLGHGLYDLFLDRSNELNYYSDRVIIDILEDFFFYCEKIDYTPRKEDFFKQYKAIRNTYFTNKLAYDSASIIKHLSKHKEMWGYEWKDFTIFVPQTPEDFKREADNQHNCVYSGYMSRVIEGLTNVIFIRDKNCVESSYITCEVNNEGQIIQFLKKHNCSHLTDQEEKFKQLFQEFLNNNWK